MTQTRPQNHVRLVRFRLVPGTDQLIHNVTTKIVPLIAAQPGCVHVTLFGRDNDYGLLVNWETAQHAENAAGVVGPQLWGSLQNSLDGPAEMDLIPVLAQAMARPMAAQK